MSRGCLETQPLVVAYQKARQAQMMEKYANMHSVAVNEDIRLGYRATTCLPQPYINYIQYLHGTRESCKDFPVMLACYAICTLPPFRIAKVML